MPQSQSEDRARVTFQVVKVDGKFFVKSTMRWPGKPIEDYHSKPFASEGDANAECQRVADGWADAYGRDKLTVTRRDG